MLEFLPVPMGARSSRFDISELVDSRAGGSLKEGDVLIVSSKFVGVSEGRVTQLRTVHPGLGAMALASRYHMDSRLCELVLRESDLVVGGVPGFLLASKDGVLTPNAGIDKSNVRHGTVVMYPRHPESSARTIREAVRFSRGLEIAVIICDSRLSPTRRGTTGVAVAASGIEAVLDMRGRTDLFGNVLRVTAQGIADDLSSAAEVLMGESDESIPVVIARGVRKDVFGESEYGGRRFSVSADECVYMRSLGYDSSA